MILNSIEDHKTLRALVHASPAFYATYCLAREEILSKVTVADLATHNIDILTPVEVAEVHVPGGKKQRTIVQGVIQKVYDQISSGQSIRLSVPECNVLSTLLELKGFVRHFDPQRPMKYSYNQTFYCLTQQDDTEYFGFHGWRDYHVLEFVPQNSTARIELKRQLGRAHRMCGVRRREVRGKASSILKSWKWGLEAKEEWIASGSVNAAKHRLAEKIVEAGKLGCERLWEN